MIRGIHHINLLVRDLDDAMERYRRMLGVDDFIIDSLEGRAVRTARFRTGDSWIVLVQPTGPGEPQRVLDEQGEGLFLLSFDVDDLDSAGEHITQAGGALRGEPRRGLEGWSVIDVAPESLFGAQIQLAEDAQKND